MRSSRDARQLADLREQVEQAEHEDVRLYSAALNDSWTAEELRRLGLGEPEKKARVRKRANGSGRGAGAVAAGSTSHTEPPDGGQH